MYRSVCRNGKIWGDVSGEERTQSFVLGLVSMSKYSKLLEIFPMCRYTSLWMLFMVRNLSLHDERRSVLFLIIKRFRVLEKRSSICSKNMPLKSGHSFYLPFVACRKECNTPDWDRRILFYIFHWPKPPLRPFCCMSERSRRFNYRM